MIGYVCKYTPIEIFEFMGEECEKIEPQKNSSHYSDAFFHSNMCSYSKGVLEACLSGKYEKLVFTNCCDSIRRVYDLVQKISPQQWIYMMELPRKVTKEAVDFYKKEIERLIRYYENHGGKEFNRADFEDYILMLKQPPKNNKGKIVLLGARTSKALKQKIKKRIPDIQDLTCTAIEDQRFLEGKDYEEGLLRQFPCMRMDMYWESMKQIVDSNKYTGVIYHTIKFCDFYSYGFAGLKDTPIRILKIETDYSDQSSGQLETRIEAFTESLQTEEKVMEAKDETIVMGIDSGSTSTNLVLMNEKGEIIDYHIVATGAKSIESATRAYKELLKKSKIDEREVNYIVATGYGRSKLPFVDECITEISCHGKGAHYFDNSVRTIIDIGGQDSKVIRIDDAGEVKEFSMNDKCAAGTGKFLEMMSNTLEMSLEEMSEAYMYSKERLEITNMCTVFAESEVISLIAQNKEKADIIAALNRSTISRVLSMLIRMGKESRYMMTGGVAKNNGVVHAIEEALNEKIVIPEEPQIVGAVGACIFALSKAKVKTQ